uniref:carboxymuconolactone decarboxylase family protein n=1 Tax=Variovorax sp. BK018 TaxID=3450241 RepID=UPI00403A0AE3
MNTPETLIDNERARIKDFFIAERGYWRPWTETMLDACPGFVEQYARYAGHPARTGPLTPRMVELIYVALDSSSSHLFESGLQTHMKRALEVGATQADIVDVLHLVAVQGLASVGQATAILAELAGPQDSRGSQAVSTALQARIDRLGHAHALRLNELARLDAGYVEVLLDFIEKGRPGAGLADAERSLVQLALHACFTAFNPDGVRQIVATGLGQGLAPAELLQGIQLGAHLAVHGSALGAKVLQACQAPPPREQSE